MTDATEMLENLARALGWKNAAALMSPSGPNGCVQEVVGHGHRAVIEVSRAGIFAVRLYRCGHEIDGVVRYRGDLPDLGAARAAALDLCETEDQTSAQLDLFT